MAGVVEDETEVGVIIEPPLGSALELRLLDELVVVVEPPIGPTVEL